MGVFQLEDALTFYGSYHNNKINQLIHVVFVPCIIWSAFVIFSYINAEWFVGHEIHLLDFLSKGNPIFDFAIVNYLNENLVIGGGLALTIGLSVYYLTLVTVPAITYDIFLFVMMATAGHFYRATPHAWQYALALHVFAWYIQIHPGHAIFEQRNAALVDNFFAGLALGPLFAWFEVLFFFGWNKELRDRLQVRIENNIAEYQASLKKVQ